MTNEWESLDSEEQERLRTAIEQHGIGAICAFCGEEGDFEDMLGLTLFPSDEPDALQQWWVHGRCVAEHFVSSALVSLREEIAEQVED